MATRALIWFFYLVIHLAFSLRSACNTSLAEEGLRQFSCFVWEEEGGRDSHSFGVL